MRQPLLETPTLSAKGKVLGRPKKLPPPDAVQRIEALAAAGGSRVGIARALGADKETLARWFNDSPELSWAFELGREAERQKLHDIIMRDAMDGEKPNVNAMFLLKCKHGYREGAEGEQGNRINVTFNLPGALTAEQFTQQMKVVKDG